MIVTNLLEDAGMALARLSCSSWYGVHCTQVMPKATLLQVIIGRWIIHPLDVQPETNSGGSPSRWFILAATSWTPLCSISSFNNYSWKLMWTNSNGSDMDNITQSHVYMSWAVPLLAERFVLVLTSGYHWQSVFFSLCCSCRLKNKKCCQSQ